MAYDAGMMRCALYEIEKESLGARVEKLYQPEKDEVVINIRSRSGGKKILIGAGSLGRISFTEIPRENPPTPPSFCLSLRKHLTNAILTSIRMEGFERAATLEFMSRDEMGFDCVRRLHCEVMGRYSNIILTDGEDVILNALKLVDLTTSSKRQVLPGFKYELPPSQNKLNPLEADADTLVRLVRDAEPSMLAHKLITDSFCGISRSNAQEIVYRATGNSDSVIEFTSPSALANEFIKFFDEVKRNDYTPTLVTLDGKVADYSFAKITHLGEENARSFDSPSEMLDRCFVVKDNEAMVRSRAADILHLLKNAESRITKKLQRQEAELVESEKMDEYKAIGDLITANIYKIKRGDEKVRLTDYSIMNEDGSFGEVEITLDKTLSPSRNAAVYYKKYNKAKTASVVLLEQIENAENELKYIESVLDLLARATTPTELADIRTELALAGYSSKIKMPERKKPKKADYLKFRTSGGYTVLCGKNNLQNDQLTHKEAAGYDYWFHAKNAPGSHCIMLCAGSEPSEKDFTEAAMIAAVHSSLSSAPMAEVDYTLARHVKKPNGAKPGFVIYHTNYSAYVKPDRDAVEKLKV